MQATETRDVLEALVDKCRVFESALLSEQMRCSSLEAVRSCHSSCSSALVL